MERTASAIDPGLLQRVMRLYPGRTEEEVVALALRQLAGVEGQGSALPERYEDLGLIDRGAMGEVRRVRDRELNRTLAMKVVLPQVALLDLGRFIEEAQVNAQLQHPGIVPVHDVGRLGDGRVWFTMTEVRGRRLDSVIAGVHGAVVARRWAQTPDGWTFRRVMDAFQRVCEAVAYAHSRGVVHRDLKPQNIMVGEFGQVFVMDWGLAKPLGGADGAIVSEGRQSGDLNETQYGRVIGTPSYMSPEQAAGEVEAVGPASDVYALGSILYHVLSGRPPIEGMVRLTRLRVQAPPPVETVVPPHIPEPPVELVELCRRAMAREQAERFPHAGELSAAIAAWLDGSKKRERALELVEQAHAFDADIAALRVEVDALREEAAELLAPLPEHAPAAEKAVGWRMEDRAANQERRLREQQTAQEQLLRDALGVEPDLPEARALLADLYRARLEAAEARRDLDAALDWEAQLRAYDDGRYVEWLNGDGVLSLVTDPPGAVAEVLRFELRDRRLVAEPIGQVATTPLAAVKLPRGSYLLRLSAPGHATVDYPVYLGRTEHWDGRDPDGEVVPIRLPRAGELGPDDVYIPAGWFWSGGDPFAMDGLPRRRVWVDPFVIRRNPVTNGEFLEFLNNLVEEGRHDDADAAAPSDKAQDAALSLLRDGRFALQSAHADAIDWPVTQVTYRAALRYAGWLTERTGDPWRLPHELEWEKAARGVDGRFFPWGDQPESTWTCTVNSRENAPHRWSVHDSTEDVGPFRVRWMAGNARAVCLNEYHRSGPPLAGGRPMITQANGQYVSVRGGAWAASIVYCRAATRFGTLIDRRLTNSGVRLVRSATIR